jgi:hypothetical protein
MYEPNVETKIQVGTSDVVAMLLQSFNDSNLVAQQRVLDEIRPVEEKLVATVVSVFNKLRLLFFQKKAKKIEALFTMLKGFGGPTFKLFKTTKEALETLIPGHVKDEVEDFYRAFEARTEILQLAGISQSISYGHGPCSIRDDHKVPSTFKVRPVVCRINTRREIREDGCDPFDFIDFQEIFLEEVFGELSGVKAFEVNIPKALHPQILSLREDQARLNELQKELAQLREVVKDQAALRNSITAKLTHALFIEAGLAVDIERVWDSLSVSVLDSMKLSLENP